MHSRLLSRFPTQQFSASKQQPLPASPPTSSSVCPPASPHADPPAKHPDKGSPHRSGPPAPRMPNRLSSRPPSSGHQASGGRAPSTGKARSRTAMRTSRPSPPPRPCRDHRHPKRATRTSFRPHPIPRPKLKITHFDSSSSTSSNRTCFPWHVQFPPYWHGNCPGTCPRRQCAQHRKGNGPRTCVSGAVTDGITGIRTAPRHQKHPTRL